MIDTMAQDLYDELYVLSFHELVDFFKRTRKGDFGKMFGGITSDTMLEAARVYLNERIEHNKNKNDHYNNQTSEYRDPNDYKTERQDTIPELMEKIKINDEIKRGKRIRL